MTESKENTHKTGKHIKVEEGMEVEVVGKSLMDDKAGRPDVITGKSSIKDRVGRPAKVANKSLDVSVRVSRGTAKNGITIVKKSEALAISGTRVQMTSNLNNPALIPPPFGSL